MTTKVKRKLTDISFEKEGSHVALVSKQQGGPANKKDFALVLKSMNFSQESIEKMQQIQVTLELPEFLSKFFGVYYSDAEVLARLMGYVPPVQDSTTEYSYEDYIQSRVDSFQVLKSLHDAENITNILSTLNETQYLSMLNDQLIIEKALANLDKPESESVAKDATESDTSTPACVEKSIEAPASKVTKSKGKQMTKPVKVEDSTTNVEQTSLEQLQKSLSEQTEQLTKALEIIAKFEAEKKEQVIKSKTAKFQAVIKDEKVLAPIVKAALTLESEDDFGAFLAAITSMAANVETSQSFIEKSALFQEQGATTSQEEKPQESAVARILKSKQTK